MRVHSWSLHTPPYPLVASLCVEQRRIIQGRKQRTWIGENDQHDIRTGTSTPCGALERDVDCSRITADSTVHPHVCRRWHRADDCDGYRPGPGEFSTGGYL